MAAEPVHFERAPFDNNFAIHGFATLFLDQTRLRSVLTVEKDAATSGCHCSMRLLVAHG